MEEKYLAEKRSITAQRLKSFGQKKPKILLCLFPERIFFRRNIAPNKVLRALCLNSDRCNQ